jgi:hypothetical protein
MLDGYQIILQNKSHSPTKNQSNITLGDTQDDT